MIPLATTLQHCNYSSREDYVESTQNLALGIPYFAFGSFFAIFYAPCMIVMLKNELWSNPCFKLMFFDALFDLGTLVANAFMPGIIMIAPFDYYCYPVVNQAIMDIWALCWNASCFTTVALAINRFIFLTSPVKWTERFYGGKRVWIWPGMATCFGLSIVIPYQSSIATMIVDTKEGIYVWPEGVDEYGHMITTITNIVTAVLLFIPYVLTLYSVHKLASLGVSQETTQIRRMEQRVLIQVLVMCSLTISACVFYPVAPLFTSDLTFFRAVHIIWIAAHGCNGILFLCLNPTIRHHVFAMCRIKRMNKVFATRTANSMQSNTRGIRMAIPVQ